MEKLIMITQNFPSGKGEIYLEREISYFANKYNEIHIYPVKILNTELRNVPSNVFVHDLISKRSGKVKSKLLFKNIFLVIKISYLEFTHTKVKRFFIFNIKTFISELLQCLELSEKFILETALKNAQCTFYSVWMDEGALMFSILKDKKKISSFIFRLHGYDLYDERRIGNYMPFRYYNFQQAKKIFIVSKAGRDYLADKKLFPEKLIVNYSGLYDKGENPFNKDTFVLVSVSNLIPLKRVDKIIDILSYIDFPITWIHFGDGSVKDKLIESATRLPKNITWKFMGQTEQDELNKFYSGTSVNLFIHLSETEGLPLAIVEAISYGIPVMACDIGGVSEIVNTQTGILLPKDFDLQQVVNNLINFSDSNLNNLEYRKGVREFWKNNFDAQKNYPKFIEMLKQ